jgi:hypothetical protein
MPTEAYLDSVVALADKVLDVYQPDQRLYYVLQLDDDELPQGGTFHLTIEGGRTIEGGSDDLRSFTAVLDAAQLAFDAAAVAVRYVAEPPDNAGNEHNTTYLRNLASTPAWTLEIEGLSAGSFSVKLKSVFGRRGRQNILAVAGIAALILTVVVPPVGGVATLAVTGLGAADQLVDNALEGRQQRKIQRQRANYVKSENAKDRRIQELHEEGVQKTAKANLQSGVKNLRSEVTKLAPRVVEPEAIDAARVTAIRVNVEADDQAA